MNSILGISAFYHDSAAALIIDGKVVAAAQEERFTRAKHDSSYPFNAVEFVLKYSNLKLSQVDHIVFYEKPFLKFERLLETYVAFAPRGFKSFCKSMPIWLKDKLFQKKILLDELKKHDENFSDEKKLYFSEHHLSHAASAFYPSPFEEAIVLTADGVGEWATTTVAIGKGNKLKILKEIHFPHSLGLLYSAFTYYIGFKVNSGEYKLMGLAPYGEPRYKSLILDKLLDIKDDGTFMLNQEYFNYSTGLTMTNTKFDNLFGQKPRDSRQEQITQFHMDIASSIQSVTEDIMIKLIGLVPQKALKEQEKQQKEPETTKKLKIDIEDDPFKDDEEQMNEMAYSSKEAGQSAQSALTQYSDILGKASQQIMRGMIDGVKSGHFEPFDIQAALKKNRPSRVHGYEAKFIEDLWLKMREKFRKYMPKGKLRR